MIGIDDEQELQKYVISCKWDDYGIKQKPNFHTHNVLSEY